MRRAEALHGAAGAATLPPAPAAGRRTRALRDHRLALQRHVMHCSRARSRWHALACLGELTHSLLAPRFVTTVVGVAGGLALGALWLR